MKSVKILNSDYFPNLTLAVFCHNYKFWHNSDTFSNILRQISDRVMQLIDFWQLSNTFQSGFRQFSHTFLTHFWNLRDPHQLRVPSFQRRRRRYFSGKKLNDRHACRSLARSLVKGKCSVNFFVELYDFIWNAGCPICSCAWVGRVYFISICPAASAKFPS